ncbi:MAG: methyl-accepting chemotaxis protein [Deferribacterales bacterium]
MSAKSTISKKFLVPLFVVIAITVCVIFLYSVKVINDIEKGVYEQETANTSTYMSKAIESKFDVCLTNAISISEISSLIDAMVADNRQDAIEIVTGLTSSLSKQLNTDYKIHVHTADMKSYIRSWKTEQYGDDLGGFRHTIKAVKNTHKPLASFEIGRSGLTFRGLSPVMDYGKYIGSLEVMLNVDALVEKAHQDIGASIVTGISNDIASTADFVKDNPTFGGYKLAQIGEYDKKLFDEISATDPSKLDNKKYFTTGSYFVVQYPVKDFEDKEVGVFYIAKDLNVVLEEVDAAKKLAKIQLLMTLVSFIIISAMVIIMLRKVVTSKLAVLIATTHDLAQGEGDLTKRIDIKTNDELETAAENMNVFIAKVQATVESSIEGITEAVHASGDLMNAASTLASNITQQKSRVEDSSQLVNEVAINLDKTEELAVSTTEVLERGRDSLKELVQSMNRVVERIVSDSDSQLRLSEAMQDLNDQAREIQNVLSIISDIADQTNLLALNASIEAARAGEHGRGFAVVADEVRKLAERTQTSLADISKITNLIVGSISTAYKEIKDVSVSMKDASEQSLSLVQMADDTSNKLDSTVSVSSEVTRMSTYIAKKTKDMIKAMDDITELSMENQTAGETVESVAGALASTSGQVSEKLHKFKV